MESALPLRVAVSLFVFHASIGNGGSVFLKFAIELLRFEYRVFRNVDLDQLLRGHLENFSNGSGFACTQFQRERTDRRDPFRIEKVSAHPRPPVNRTDAKFPVFLGSSIFVSNVLYLTCK